MSSRVFSLQQFLSNLSTMGWGRVFCTLQEKLLDPRLFEILTGLFSLISPFDGSKPGSTMFCLPSRALCLKHCPCVSSTICSGLRSLCRFLLLKKKTNIMNIKRFSDLLTYSLNLISLFVLNHITCKRENATHFYFRTVFKVNSLFSFGVVVVRDGTKDYGE